MSTTTISWAQRVWNPVTGCTPVSSGCQHCFARRVAQRLGGRYGYPPVGYAFRVTLHENRLEEPLHWKKPSHVFVASMGDLFHKDVDEKYIAKVFAIMDLARQHRYMILTKRPERMRELITDEDFQFHVGWFQSQAVREFNLPEPRIDPWPLQSVCLGVSVEDQATADERIPLLLQTPAAVRFVSAEPVLGDVGIEHWLPESGLIDTGHGRCGWCGWFACSCGREAWEEPGPYLSWVIAGSETGVDARPARLDWFRSLRDQCQAASVPFWLKQTGTRPEQDTLLDGREWRESPACGRWRE